MLDDDSEALHRCALADRIARAIMVAPTPVAEAEPHGSGLAWVVGGGIVLAMIALSQCSPKQAASTLPVVSVNYNYNAEVSNAIAAQKPPSPEPLSAAGVARGTAHLRQVFAAESFSGAMIYSQNCYDALGHEFSWARLDRCGAFDALAVRSAADADMTGFDNEAAWFQSEVAAGRYLSAATGAGEAADEADQRLSNLQTKVARSKAIGLRQGPAVSSEIGNIVESLANEGDAQADD